MVRFAFRLSRIAAIAVLSLTACQSAWAGLIDFNDLSLAPESSFDGGGPGVHTQVGSFTSGGATFGYSVTNYNDFDPPGVDDPFTPDIGFASGFAYSNRSDTTTGDYTNPHSAITGVGHTSVVSPPADNYGISFGYANVLPGGSLTLGDIASLPFFDLPTGAAIVGAWVTNTTYAYMTMLEGNDFAKKFGGDRGTDGDYFKLTAYGLTASGDLLAPPVELMLADYRFTNPADDYILDQWTYLDLSSLAGASRIAFNVSSTDIGLYGMNTPGYFAIDDITFDDLSSVPEPTSIALLLTGGLGLVCMRRKRKSAV